MPFSKDNVIALSKEDFRYPAEWLKYSDAPKVLYCVGNLALLQTRKIAVVGSRRTPKAMLSHTSEVAKTLSESVTIVTGVADGGDLATVEGAMSGTGKIICLLAGGFSALPQSAIEILKRVAERGLVLALHDYDTGVRVFSYEYRNKMLAILCEGVLVVGADEKSGALITAKYAREYGKEVFAFPYPPNAYGGVGCNRLIKTGAHLTENAEDITEVLGLVRKETKREIPLSETEETVLKALRELGEEHIAKIAEKSGLPLFKVRAILSALEVKKCAISVGGNRYTAV